MELNFLSLSLSFVLSLRHTHAHTFTYCLHGRACDKSASQQEMTDTPPHFKNLRSLSIHAAATKRSRHQVKIPPKRRITVKLVKADEQRADPSPPFFTDFFLLFCLLHFFIC